ncbi:MerR family transcriptional regulator [Massilia horti]|uniref:MerR family transcriptional regulator n=1 Tax=Massilia horti TaxID=2562153 RepID=A0A4Y9T2I7_9BURK|nr:MerR family transcriptional regulator [Massilia horti]TFW34013.1 MerR family transcriptional regulator [Massilia horti]
MLKVGELAARAHLTVRTLHHYDSIGLLRPSARSDAGYRLYNRQDVARLQQIQALRGFGMALSDIGKYLDSPEASALKIVERQLSTLERQIAQAAHMHELLLQLRQQLAEGEEPDLSTWLTTLEQMTMYEKHFTKDELEQLPLYRDPGLQAEWKRMVGQAQQLMDTGVAPSAPEAKAFALRWLERLEHDSGGNHAFMLRLTSMVARHPQAAEHEFGLTPALMDYVRTAIGELKFDVWAKYLAPDVIERMRRHHAARGGEWVALGERVHDAIRRRVAPSLPEAKELARQWGELFLDMVGPTPEATEQFRRANKCEPILRMGSGISDEVLDFLRKVHEAR